MKYLTLLVLLISCKKPVNVSSDDPNNIASSLTATWKLSEELSSPAYDWNQDGTPETDMYATYAQCRKDRTIAFNAGYTGVIIECSLNLPTKWRIADNSTFIRYSFSTNGGVTYGSEVVDSVITLNSTTLKLSYHAQPPTGTQVYTLTSTYQRQ